MAEARKKLFNSKRILITGGTGSLGKVLLRRLLGEDAGNRRRSLYSPAMRLSSTRYGLNTNTATPRPTRSFTRIFASD